MFRAPTALFRADENSKFSFAAQQNSKSSHLQHTPAKDSLFSRARVLCRVKTHTKKRQQKRRRDVNNNKTLFKRVSHFFWFPSIAAAAAAVTRFLQPQEPPTGDRHSSRGGQQQCRGGAKCHRWFTRRGQSRRSPGSHPARFQRN